MLPNAFVIGAPRSGTTSIYEYLDAHPDVVMGTVKEPDFFLSPWLDEEGPDELAALAAREPSRQAALAAYEALWSAASTERIRGEASAVYLADPDAAARLRRFVPDAKLVVVLRDPASRAHSHLVHAQRVRGDFAELAGGGETLERELLDAVARAEREGPPERPSNDGEVWVSSGYYHRHLTRWEARFPADQLHLELFEDLAADPAALMRRVFSFLGVDDTFVLPTTAAFNASVVPRNRRLFSMFTTRTAALRWARGLAPARVRAAVMRIRNRALAGAKPELDPALRRRLVDLYHDDVVRLQEQLGRDLSPWLR